MAAIPTAGGARYAPRVVIRALLRVALLGGLVIVGWLLASGISYADEDPGQPGPGLIQVANAVSSDDGLGTPAAVGPAVKRVLSGAASGVAVPRLLVQPPAQAGILRPIVKAVGIAKPVDEVLPVSRPLSVPAQHPAPARQMAAMPPPAQAGKATTTQPAAPTVAGQRAAPTPAFTPVVHAKSPRPCSPVPAAAVPMTVQPVLGGGPVAPLPANPPGSTTSLCTISVAGGGAGSKNGSDVVADDVKMTGGRTQHGGPLDRDTSGLPRSLSVQPSTSPD